MLSLPPRLRLLPQSTPVEPLRGSRQLFAHDHLFIKREDLSAPVYGGNKVRNLEFILGDALARKAERLVTVAPIGSNFTTALAAQAARFGLPVDVYQFFPRASAQMLEHAEFIESQGARIRPHLGPPYLGAALATLKASVSRSYVIAPGGSNALGVLGHVSAGLELAQQVRDGEIPEPDLLIVGVGTCGTMAGLLLAMKLAGLETRIVGVRCVDSIVCNRTRVAHLANRAARLLGLPPRIEKRDVHIYDPPYPLRYGQPLNEATELIAEMKCRSGIRLDTTYTSKVALFMREYLRDPAMTQKKVLYWHTYCAPVIPARRLDNPRPLPVFSAHDDHLHRRRCMPRER